IRDARRAVGAALVERGLDPAHVAAVVSVSQELLVAALEQHTTAPGVLSVEPFPLLTSVRLRCLSLVDLREDPFPLRERVLSALTIGFGRRANADGGTDLWAEVPRPHAPG